jgi:hypothetical protein
MTANLSIIYNKQNHYQIFFGIITNSKQRVYKQEIVLMKISSMYNLFGNQAIILLEEGKFQFEYIIVTIRVPIIYLG